MNFNFLNRKKDKHLFLKKGFKASEKRIGKESYFSLNYRFFFNFKNDIEILCFNKWHKTWEFKSLGLDSGLIFLNEGRKDLLLISEYLNEKGDVVFSESTLLPVQKNINFNYPKIDEYPGELRFKLSIRTSIFSGYKLSLINYRVVNKDQYIEKILGSGIEIGPGHNPKIKHENVKYLEKYGLDEWKEANKIQDDSKLDFSKYIQGDAHNIPVEDGTLDFIFSSHVFEHLHNPIGHLRHWASKLAPGGKVACVVPGIYGAKDYFAEPSTIENMLEQDARNSFDIPLEAYQYYNDIREWKLGGEKLLQENRSIHVHFYEKKIVNKLLNYAVEELGFSSYFVDYDRNHKDFYFELIK